MAKFIGNRCIPTPEGKWDKTKEYLGLSVVLDEETGDSYTSKKVVPAGTELTNKDYWALSGQYNAQMTLIKLQLEAMQNIPEGGTTADAALENIRIGADGTEYATPGDAVRGQVGALSKKIDNIITIKNGGIPKLDLYIGNGLYKDNTYHKVLAEYEPKFKNRIASYLGDSDLKSGDVLGLTNYNTYKFAIGCNSELYAWINGGYQTSDLRLNNSTINYAKMILIARLDNADMTQNDIDTVKELLSVNGSTNIEEISLKGKIVNIKNLNFELPKNDLASYIHLSFDDVTYCFSDIADHIDTYTSIFDCAFLSSLKRLHDTYGAKFSLYCYDISSAVKTIANKFEEDFNKNSGWLKFGFHSYSAGKNLAGYTAFLNDMFALGMTINSIDRFPRLDRFSGSKSDILAMRDTDCGIIGLLTADDTRSSYYLTAEQNEFLQKHSKLIDYENGLLLYSTNMRLDWFYDGFTSDYSYNIPVKNNPYDELVYRIKDKAMGNLYSPLAVFTHEWRVYNSSYVLNNTFDYVEQVCKFAKDWNYDFDYPMIRENFGITKFEPVINNDGILTKSEISFSNWSLGAIDDSGEIVSSITRIITPIFKATKLVVEVPSGYKVNIAKYSRNEAKPSYCVSITGWDTINRTLTDGYFVIAMSTAENTATVEMGDLLTVVATR